MLFCLSLSSYLKKLSKSFFASNGHFVHSTIVPLRYVGPTEVAGQWAEINYDTSLFQLNLILLVVIMRLVNVVVLKLQRISLWTVQCRVREENEAKKRLSLFCSKTIIISFTLHSI
jgi:hypothetical protein